MYLKDSFLFQTPCYFICYWKTYDTKFFLKIIVFSCLFIEI